MRRVAVAGHEDQRRPFATPVQDLQPHAAVDGDVQHLVRRRVDRPEGLAGHPLPAEAVRAKGRREGPRPRLAVRRDVAVERPDHLVQLHPDVAALNLDRRDRVAVAREAGGFPRSSEFELAVKPALRGPGHLERARRRPLPESHQILRLDRRRGGARRAGPEGGRSQREDGQGGGACHGRAYGQAA